MPLTRRQIYRRRRLVVFGGLFALLAGIAYLPLTLLAPVGDIDPEVAAPAVPASDAVSLELPDYGASAIAAVGSDDLLAQHGSTEPVPIASITKLIAALTVLDAHPIAPGETGPSITMTAADTALYRHYDGLGASVAPVRAGVVYTQHELLEIMLIDSAGNYAVTLTNWAFGSPDAFLAAARAWLADNGFTTVTITEPTGRDPANRATAAELVRLGELALADPVLAGIVATATTDIHDVGRVDNTNKLLGIDGVDGIKTGTLNAYGANLLFSADLAVGSESIPLVGVVLGAVNTAQLNADILELIARVRAGYREVPLVAAGDVVAHYTTTWDATTTAVAAESATIVVWGDTPVEVEARVESIRLAEAGDDVGSLSFTAGTRTVEVPLELSHAVEDPGPWWRLGNPRIIFGLE